MISSIALPFLSKVAHLKTVLFSLDVTLSIVRDSFLVVMEGKY